MKKKHSWFASKSHGYGAGQPIAWQGWLSLLLFFIGILFFSIYCSGWLRITGIFCCVVIFLIIAYYKTENGWRCR